jgi:hypothetical protein
VLTAPAPLACNVFSIGITINIGAFTISGTLEGKYARTWKLVQPTTVGAGLTPQMGQVRRVLVNGDLPSPSTTTPCPIPPCYQAAPCVPGPVQQHWVGHIDYACIQSLRWYVAFSLHHLPGVISHNPATSPCRVVPSGFDHPADGFHVVAPSPFSWSPSAAPPTVNGPMTMPNPGQGIHAQSLRPEVFAGACDRREAPIVSTGTGQVVDSTALCTGQQVWWDIVLGPVSTLQLSNANFRSVPCGSTWPGGLPTPSGSSGLLGVVLGDWTNPNVFPYVQRLTLYWGCVRSSDPCVFGSPDLQDFATGISTDDMTYPTSTVTAELFPYDSGGCFFGKVMMDLQNAGGFQPPPGEACSFRP